MAIYAVVLRICENKIKGFSTNTKIEYNKINFILWAQSKKLQKYSFIRFSELVVCGILLVQSYCVNSICYWEQRNNNKKKTYHVLNWCEKLVTVAYWEFKQKYKEILSLEKCHNEYGKRCNRYVDISNVWLIFRFQCTTTSISNYGKISFKLQNLKKKKIVWRRIVM